MKLLPALLAAACQVAVSSGLDNGLALTPQMGYNSWYDLQCSGAMNESTLRATADKMVAAGLPQLGYNYLALDDCYVHSRLPNGTLVPDPAKFPSGMRALADYVHSKGLLFGVYTARCRETCAGRPASLDNEQSDAHTFAVLWDADYLKEDSCRDCSGAAAPIDLYAKMRDALNATGKRVLFDMCWGSTQEMERRVVTGNSWRIGPDDGNWVNIIKNIDIDSRLAQYAGPGHWNNPCLLISRNQAGKPMITEQQTLSQFSAYAMLAAPMMISGSLLKMSAETLSAYTNKEVIAVSQDPLGKQGIRVAGGDLAGHVHPAPPAGDTNQLLFVSECSGAATQNWTMGAAAGLPDGYVRSARGWCLNVDNCNTNVGVIVYPHCPTKGCCDDCRNMIFKLDSASGHIVAGQDTALCLVPDFAATTVTLQPCASAPRWAYNEATGGIYATSGGKDMCLTDEPNHLPRPSVPAPAPPPTAPSTNVWARNLTGGRLALFFFNVGSSAVDVTCDAACFAAAGVGAGGAFAVRDIIAHRDVGQMTGASWIAKGIPADGGSATLLLTPKSSEH